MLRCDLKLPPAGEAVHSREKGRTMAGDGIIELTDASFDNDVLKSDQPVIYFLTVCRAKRQKVLANDEAFTALRTAIGRLTNWKVIAAERAVESCEGE